MEEPTHPLEELFPKRRKRKYQLSAPGRKKLRQRIRHNQPWLCTHGPKTKWGLKRASQNALRHGMYTREFADQLRLFQATLKEVQRLTGMKR